MPECGGPEPSGVGPCSDLCKAERVALIVIIIAVDYCHRGCLAPNPTVRLQADVSLHLMPRTPDPSMQLLTRVDPRGFSLPLPRLLGETGWEVTLRTWVAGTAFRGFSFSGDGATQP